MNAWFKIWLVTLFMLLAVSITLVLSVGGYVKRAEELTRTISELEARNKLISDRVSDIVADTQRQLDAATTTATTSRQLGTGLSSAVDQSNRLTERLERADKIAGVLVTAIAGLIETEQLLRVEVEDK